MAKTPAPPPATSSADPAAAPATGAGNPLAASVAKLSPDEAAAVLALIEKALKRRKIQLWGYLVAVVVLIAGMLGALYYYGSQDEGTFVGWVFLVPMGLVGLVLYGFGAWSERYRTAVEDRFMAHDKTRRR